MTKSGRTAFHLVDFTSVDLQYKKEFKQAIHDSSTYRKLFMDRVLPKVAEIVASRNSTDFMSTSERSIISKSIPHEDSWSVIMSFIG
mmetsp:Transcript_4231/g.4342  ORF Transcript_4231/g.4342 Transcript_4231/m.4342 type:complete len:87 (-) Transcript_4231:178-438(-)